MSNTSDKNTFTPHNDESASYTTESDWRSRNISEVPPEIARDIEEYEPAKLQRFIGMLLQKCCEASSDGNTNDTVKLFNACRQTILSEWTKKLQDETESPILVNLWEYCEAASETERCPLFVLMANEALQMLRGIKHQGIRGPNTDLDILFFASDSQKVHGTHGSSEIPSVTIRKPHGGVTSLRAAKLFTVTEFRAEFPFTDWNFIATMSALRPDLWPSNRHLQWHHFLSALELKFESTISMPADLSPAEVQPPIPHQKPDEIFMPSSANHEHSEPITDMHAPPAVQCGLYGAEMLCGSLGTMHAINLLIIDNVIWAWWYDRQGCIQVEGFNFLQDLPTFFVLLYALQRLKLDQWGLNANLDGRVRTAHTSRGPYDV